MPIQVPFIGREVELKEINDSIQQWNSEKIVCINGNGGVGKTRLLQEIQQQQIVALRQAPDLRLIILPITDFDNVTFHVPNAIGLKIARLLGEANFTKYIESFLDLRKMELADLSQKRIAEESLAVNRAFANCFNVVSTEKRVVLFLDTTDSVGDLDKKAEVWQYLAGILRNAKNYLLLMAGRNTKEIGEFLQQKFGYEIQVIQLAPLDIEASELYLQQKQAQLYVNLEPDVAQKLLLLAHGRPILIDLAVEWLARNIPIDWLIKCNLKELENLSDSERIEYQKKFELELVRHIADMRHSINRLTLLMAKIYPLDKSLLAQLFSSWSTDKIDQQFEEAKGYIFVKTLPNGSITLHDEMRRLVNEHVLDLVDPDGDRRVRDSQIAAVYLKTEVEKFDKRLRDKSQNYTDLERAELEAELDLVTQQWITHSLIWDINKGFAVYQRCMDQAQKAKRFHFAEQLAEIVLPYIYKLDENQLFSYRLLYSKQITNLDNPEKAITLLKELLAENQGNLSREAELYNMLAISEVQRGEELPAAIKYQENCLRAIETAGSIKDIPTVSNYMGYIYRLSGNWQKAMEFYNRALEAALILGSKTNTIASILNNLGYVSGMDGRFVEAIDYCEKAIILWQQQNNELAVGQNEATLGAIYANQGDYELAQSYLNKAVVTFRKFEAIERLVGAYTELGFVHCIQAAETRNIEQYKRAEDYLQESLGLAMRHRLLKQIPKIQLYLGYVALYLDNDNKTFKEKDFAYIDRAYEMGLEFLDLYIVTHSLVAKAEYDYSKHIYDDIPNYAQELQDDYEAKGYQFPLFFGRMKRILADIAFEQQDYAAALELYKQGLTQIAQHGGHGKYAIKHELKNLGHKIEVLPIDVVKQWSSALSAHWQQQTPIENYASMLSWCKQLDLAIKLRSHNPADSGVWTLRN